MDTDKKTLENFVKTHVTNSGYEFIDKKDDRFINKLIFKFQKQRNRIPKENSLYFIKGEEKLNILIYNSNYKNINITDIIEHENNNASNGVYTAHIFQKDGIDFGVERYTSNPSKDKKEGKPIILRPLEQEIVTLKPHILAYFSQAQNKIELYIIKTTQSGIGTAYKINDVVLGGLYFPHDEQSKRAVPYYKPEIEISEVLKFNERKSSFSNTAHSTSKKIVLNNF